MRNRYFLFLLLFCSVNVLAQEQGIFFNPSPLLGTADAGYSSEIHFTMVDEEGNPVITLGEFGGDGRFELIGPDAGEFALPSYNYPSVGMDPFIYFQPTTPGNKQATLVVYYDGPASPDSVQIFGVSEVPIEPNLVMEEADTINFGRVNLGSSSNRTLTISNNGVIDLNITEFQMDISSAMTSSGQFQVNNSLPIVVPPLESVDLDIEFTTTSPADSGTFYNGILTKDAVGVKMSIISDDPDGPHTITLNATESEPDLEVVSSMDFERTTIGNNHQLSLTINNIADGYTDGDLEISGISFSGDFPSYFSTDLASPLTIPPGGSSEVNVIFTPDSIGDFSGTLHIEGNKTAEIALQGTGTQPRLDLPSSIDFGDVLLDVEKYQSIHIPMVASGGEDVTILSATFTGPDTSAYVYYNYSSSPYVIEYDGESITNTVRLNGFRSDGAGVKNATITLTSTAVNSPHVIDVTANLVTPLATTDIDSINVGDIIQNTTRDTTITVTNTGSATLNISSIKMVGTNRDQFNLTDLPSFPLALGVDDSVSVTVSSAPTNTMGDISAYVEINSNDLSTPAKVNMYMNVLAPVVTLSNQPLDLGSVFSTRDTANGLFYIKNSGTSDLVVSEVAVDGTHAAEFELINLELPFTVPAGDSASVEVNFLPQSSGDKNAEVNIVSNDVAGPATFALKGMGVEPVLHIASSIHMGDIAINRISSEKKVTITNNGSLPLEIYDINIKGDDAEVFTLKPVITPLSVDPGETTSMYLTFSPVENRSYFADLEIESNDLGSPEVVELKGYGALVPEATAWVDTVNFGTADFGELVTNHIVIENTGSAPLVISHIYTVVISGGFGLLTDLPKTVTPGDTAMFKVNFFTSSPGEFLSVFQFNSNDPHTPELKVACLGRSKGPIIHLSENTLDFGTATIGNTDTLSVTLSNKGDSDLSMRYYNPDDNAVYEIYYEGIPFEGAGTYKIIDIPPGGTQKVNVVFRPKSIGYKEATLNLVWLGLFNAPKDYPIKVKGLGKEAQQVTVGGVTLKADTVIVDGADKRILRGNVSSEKIKFTGDVLVNLSTKKITGTGDVYVTDIPKVGNYGGDVVKLQEKGFAYEAQDDVAELIVQSGLSAGNNAFKIMGLPLKVTKFNLIQDGIRIGGEINLPPAVFGPDAGLFIDSLEITSTEGVQIVGRASLSPTLKIKNLLHLNNAYVEFNTYEDNFAGGGEIGFNVLNKGVKIAAGIVIKKGGLDEVTMAIQVSPGIPLGTTGWALAGGNGFIKGLQVPPIALGLGVDLLPTIPGGVEVVRMNNMSISYTFGTSFDGSGTLQIFGQDVAGGGISVSLQKISVEAFINLYEVFSGDLAAAMTFGKNKYSIEASANMAVTIPKPANCSVCDWIPGLLPYKIASASAYFKNNKLSANVTVHVVIDVELGIALLFENSNTKVEVGINLNPINSGGRIAAASRSRLAGMIRYENDVEEMKKNRLEGQSIILDLETPANARMQDDEVTEFPFTIDQAYKNLFIRVVGDMEVPDFNIVLPTGQEITPENAEEMGVYQAENVGEDLRVYIFENVLLGDYILKIKGSGTHEIDFFASGFSPELSIKNILHDDATDNVNIEWEDKNYNSDATISWFYDVDREGANGWPIIRDILEDDEEDSFLWEADTLKNGTYYIYGVIDDGSNTPVHVYYPEPLTIEQPSPIDIPVLEEPVIRNDSIVLKWSAVEQAAHYLVYHGEDTISYNSNNINVGDTTGFVITSFAKGRTYDFAVTAVTEDFVESNLSNMYSVEYISEISNNTPKFKTQSFVDKVDVGATYQTNLSYTDADADDTHTLELLKAPEGMSVDQEGTITWTTDDPDVGQHQVRLLLKDNHEAADSISFTIMVMDEKSSQGIVTLNSYRFNGAGEEVSVTVNDPGLNLKDSVADQSVVTVVSTFDNAGIDVPVVETGVNTGVFKGTFTFKLDASDEPNAAIGVAAADSVFVIYHDQKPAKDIVKLLLYESSEELNNFPTAITLNNDIIPAEANISELIGLFTAVDDDKKDTHSYSLVEGVGSDNNAFFAIDGNSLKANTYFDMEEDTVFTIRVRATDTMNGFFEQAFSIRKETITALDENHLSNRVSIYPNPTSGRIEVEVTKLYNEPVKITLLSVEGNILKSTEISSGDKLIMDLSEMSSGVYFMKVEQGDSVIIKKVGRK